MGEDGRSGFRSIILSVGASEASARAATFMTRTTHSSWVALRTGLSLTSDEITEVKVKRVAVMIAVS